MTRAPQPGSDDALNLSGKIVLVTGAAGGIGRATACRFSKMGAQVVVSDLDPAGLSETADLCGAAFEQVEDFTDARAGERLVRAVTTRCGRLDVLVNAGAVILRKNLADVSPTDFDLQVAINMATPFHLARAAATAMREQGDGRIILLSSQGAQTGGYIGSTVYAMTKAAIISLTKSLAREFAAHRITVNAIAPGLVDTAMARDGVSEDALASFRDMIPMGRLATPEEVANCCLFLASDWASYITGHTLDVNGGQLMR